MRRTGLALLACLLLPTAAQAKKPADPVLTTLAQIERRGGTQAADAQGWREDYTTAKRAARALRGTPQSNIRGVLANLGSLARRQLLGTRAYPAFLILERNIEWFYSDRRSAPAYGTRTTFDGSELIWQYYPGSGWQLQPLANFGRLNGLLKLRKPAAGRLEKFADDMLATAVKRRGFLAFEYYFPWGGGAPGWISGMATATGMQAFANLSKRDGDPRYTNAARSMLGAFKAPPPWGVTVQGKAGPSFLLYSQSPSVLVGNGIAQAVIALDNYRIASRRSGRGGARGRAVAEARRLLPLFDTGAWSLYDRTPTRPGGGIRPLLPPAVRGLPREALRQVRRPVLHGGRQLRPLRDRAGGDQLGEAQGAAQAQAHRRELHALQARLGPRDAGARRRAASTRSSGGMGRGRHTLTLAAAQGRRLRPRGGRDEPQRDRQHRRHASDDQCSSACSWSRPVTVRHDCQVIRRITSVIARPMSGSPTSRPSATTAALATTARLTRPSTRAWLPSAISAGLSSRRPARQPDLRGDLVAGEADRARERQHARGGRWPAGGSSRWTASTAGHDGADEDRQHDEVAGTALGCRRAQQERAPSGIAVSASPKLWIRSASSATLPVSAKTSACATAVASSTARLADTARTPSRERLMDSSTSPCV